jgi:hypothetical protein
MESKEEKKTEGGVDEDFMTTPAILDKYKASAEVANKALEKAIELCVGCRYLHYLPGSRQSYACTIG